MVAVLAAIAAVLGTPGKPAPAKPNIVFILTDDLSWDLVNPRFTPHIAALQRRGVTFDRYFVSNSLCCPSRTSILTGDYSHTTGVWMNHGQHGGFESFGGRYNPTGDDHTVARPQRRFGACPRGRGRHGCRP